MQLLGLLPPFNVNGVLRLTKGKDRKMQHPRYCSCNCFTVVQYTQVNNEKKVCCWKGSSEAGQVECALLESPDKLNQHKLKGKKKERKEWHWSKRNTSTERKMTVRDLEHDKGVSFAPQSSTCTKWRLAVEDGHTVSTCSIQIPSGIARAQAVTPRLNS